MQSETMRHVFVIGRWAPRLIYTSPIGLYQILVFIRVKFKERKVLNKRPSISFRRRRVDEDKLLATPAGQISAEDLERAQNIMIRNAKRAEQARLRYQRKQQEKGITGRKPRKAKVDNEENDNDSSEPNLGTFYSAAIFY